MGMWIVGLVTVAQALMCQKYQCAGERDSGGLCLKTLNDTVTVYECEDGMFCPPLEGFEEVMCQPESNLHPLVWPGEYCATNASCVTQKCEDSRCGGRNLGDLCIDHSQCDIGMYCNTSNHCDLQLTGSSRMPCRDDYDCRNYLSCQQGECVHYMTLTEGDLVYDCSNNRSLACDSTFCAHGHCLKALHNDKQTLPVRCESREDCVSSWYSSEKTPFPLYVDCVCGKNEDGTGVCELFPGDQPYVAFREILFWFLDRHGNWACHTLRRFSLPCLRESLSHWRYKRLASRYLLAEYYPQLITSSPCVHQVFVPAYYSLVSSACALAALVTFTSFW